MRSSSNEIVSGADVYSVLFYPRLVYKWLCIVRSWYPTLNWPRTGWQLTQPKFPCSPSGAAGSSLFLLFEKQTRRRLPLRKVVRDCGKHHFAYGVACEYVVHRIPNAVFDRLLLIDSDPCHNPACRFSLSARSYFQTLTGRSEFRSSIETPLITIGRLASAYWARFLNCWLSRSSPWL